MDIDAARGAIELTPDELKLLMLDEGKNPWPLSNAIGLFDVITRGIDHYTSLEGITYPNLAQRAAIRAAGQVAVNRLNILQKELAPYIDASQTGEQAEQFLRDNST